MDRERGSAAAHVACPSCGLLLDPPPVSSRRCPRCRERIVVRRTEGRTVYITEAAVTVFEAQRRREADDKRWTRERREWLRLAEIVGVPERRRAGLDARPISEEVVAQSRSLYLAGADQAVRAARRDRRWEAVGRIRHEQAAALYREAGSPVPPPEAIVAVHREAVAAELRFLSASGREAELVGSACCSACRRDDGRAFRIADELKALRLPHEGCPRGLCGCEWWMSLPDPARKRRRRASRTASGAPPRREPADQGGEGPPARAVEGRPDPVPAEPPAAPEPFPDGRRPGPNQEPGDGETV